MKYDLQKHKLLSILVGQTLKFDSDELPDDEPMGVSFDKILKEMNCNKIKLNLIASELYLNKEIGYHDTEQLVGLYCDKSGTISFSNNKYRRRYWNDIIDFWNKLSQAIIPILALIVAIIALLD